MNRSLITAGTTTHLKIVAVALVGAILVVAVGIAGHAASTQAGWSSTATVVKAGKPSAYSGHDGSTIR